LDPHPPFYPASAGRDHEFPLNPNVGLRALLAFRFVLQLRKHSEGRIDLFVDTVTSGDSQVDTTV
jgi:hypothetical protein